LLVTSWLAVDWIAASRDANASALACTCADRRWLSSTSSNDTFHGLLCEAATKAEIQQLVQYFADGARRARLAVLDCL
jgi:2,4-dienoyl-CoA reductase-like NADH-dependent reductase (Old Yellow Enzyme family)